jgi:endonuclease G
MNNNPLKILALCVFCTGLNLASAQEYSDSLQMYFEELNALRLREQQVQARIEYLRRNVSFAKIGKNSVPSIDTEDAIVEHSAMLLSYDEASEGPEWVSHIVYPETETDRAKRKNNFRQDKKVSTLSATADYYSSLNKLDDDVTYDRGHMAPSADFSWWQRAMDESFYYSNMSPQQSGLNRNKWRIMEDVIRAYSTRTGNLLYVTTGPLFTGIIEDPLPDSKIDIPGAYFKVIVDPIAKTGIGFVLPNDFISTKEKLINYYHSIDDIEEMTGLDFFEDLDDNLEWFVEGEADPLTWLPAEEVGVIPDYYLTESLRNTTDLDLVVGNGKVYTFCGGVEQVVENTKSYTIYISTEYTEQPLVVSISKEIAEEISLNFKQTFNKRYVYVRGKLDSYRSKKRIVVKESVDFGLLRL